MYKGQENIKPWIIEFSSIEHDVVLEDRSKYFLHSKSDQVVVCPHDITPFFRIRNVFSNFIRAPLVQLQLDVTSDFLECKSSAGSENMHAGVYLHSRARRTMLDRASEAGLFNIFPPQAWVFICPHKERENLFSVAVKSDQRSGPRATSSESALIFSDQSVGGWNLFSILLYLSSPLINFAGCDLYLPNFPFLSLLLLIFADDLFACRSHHLIWLLVLTYLWRIFYNLSSPFNSKWLLVQPTPLHLSARLIRVNSGASALTVGGRCFFVTMPRCTNHHNTAFVWLNGIGEILGLFFYLGGRGRQKIVKIFFGKICS